MNLTKNLTSVLMASTILIGGSLISANDAQANAWMVKKVSKATQPYCAMIKRYSNERVLSFAQRDSAQISAAIDFGDKFLDKGRAYSITLSDGDGFSRRFEVKPASSSAVVVKLNRKDPILERIAAKGDLSVNIAGVLSTFNVSDLDKGLEQLETCHSGATPMRSADASSSMAERMADIAPAAGDSVNDADATSAAHSLYSRTANAKINELENGKNKLEAALQENQAKLAALENKVLSTENVAKTQQNGLVNQVSTMQSTLEKQSLDMAKMKVQLADSNEKIAFYQGMEGQRHEIESKLQAAEANLANAMQQNSALSSQIATLQASSAQASEQATVIGQLNAQITQLQQANTNLTQQTATLQHSSAQASDQATVISQLNAQIMQLQQANTNLTQEIASLRQSAMNVQQVNATVSQKDIEIQNLHSALQSAQATISSLEQGIANMQPAAGLETPDAEIMALEAQLTAVEMEKKNLQADISTMQRQIKTDNSEIIVARLEKSLDEANKALDRAGKENASLYQKFIQTEKQLSEAKLTPNDSKNWDVQKATSRYNEAQREIRRLAMHLESSKQQCSVEKENIEKLLFDPKITSQQQQDKLAALEAKLHDASKVQQNCDAKMAELNQKSVITREKLDHVTMTMAAQAHELEAAQRVAEIAPAAGMTSTPAAVKMATAPKDVQKEDRSIALVNVLNGANMDLSNEITKYTTSIQLHGASFDQGYSWTSGAVTGSYERFSVKSGALDTWTSAYNNALSAQCSGDFAVMPSKKSSAQLSANDVACVNGDVGTTSSLVFTQNGDYLDVYKLSGNIQDMTKLMDSRDKISASVKKSL
tara:strand:- start:311897 stop:314380 length:2484 start_codon:yes stop_codon:yes gene_type:complete